MLTKGITTLAAHLRVVVVFLPAPQALIAPTLHYRYHLIHHFHLPWPRNLRLPPTLLLQHLIHLRLRKGF